MSQYAFYLDADRCVGCKTCLVACKDKKDLKPGRKFRRVYTCASGEWKPTTNGNYTHKNVFGYSVSISCNHCKEPACMAACPADAIVKCDDGIVYIMQSRCTGCGACAEACPYEAPSMNKDTGKMDKCDFCRELVGTGEKPVCVTSCIMRALDCGEYEELLRKHPENNVSFPPLPDPELTFPAIIITPNRRITTDTEASMTELKEAVRASND